MSANEMKQMMQEYRRLRAILPLSQLRSQRPRGQTPRKESLVQ